MGYENLKKTPKSQDSWKHVMSTYIVDFSNIDGYPIPGTRKVFLIIIKPIKQVGSWE